MLCSFGFGVSGPGGLGSWYIIILVHGWDRIKNVHVYSILGLATHKNVNCCPTMVKHMGSCQNYGPFLGP